MDNVYKINWTKTKIIYIFLRDIASYYNDNHIPMSKYYDSKDANQIYDREYVTKAIKPYINSRKIHSFLAMLDRSSKNNNFTVKDIENNFDDLTHRIVNSKIFSFTKYNRIRKAVVLGTVFKATDDAIYDVNKEIQLNHNKSKISYDYLVMGLLLIIALAGHFITGVISIVAVLAILLFAFKINHHQRNIIKDRDYLEDE